MKNWKLAYKVMAIDVGIVLFIGLMTGLANGRDFGLALGIVCLIGAIINIVIGIIASIASSREMAKGFLLSGGILLLLSGISCGTGLANTNFH